MVSDFAPEFLDKLNNMRELTLFAPSNEALNETDHLRADKKYLREILNLHLVNERLPLEKIERNNVHTVSLYFYAIHFSLLSCLASAS